MVRRSSRLIWSDTNRLTVRGHSSRGQAAQFGEEFPGGRLILARGVERFGKSATLRKGRQPWGTHDRGIAGVRPAVAKQRLEGSSTLGGRDRCAGAFGQRGSAANLGPCSPGD